MSSHAGWSGTALVKGLAAVMSKTQQQAEARAWGKPGNSNVSPGIVESHHTVASTALTGSAQALALLTHQRENSTATTHAPPLPLPDQEPGSGSLPGKVKVETHQMPHQGDTVSSDIDGVLQKEGDPV